MDKMHIFEAAKVPLKFLGLIDRNHSNGRLINMLQRTLGLILTYSITILPLVTIFFDSKTFAEKSEASQAFTVGATNSSFLVILIVNRDIIFDMFKMLEMKIEERKSNVNKYF